MREVDVKEVADLVTAARQSLGGGTEGPTLGYMMLPDYKPTYAYRYYNVRSRHLRLQEVFFAAYTDERDGGGVAGVLSFSDFDRRKAYLKVLAFDEDMVGERPQEGLRWLLHSGMSRLREFRPIDSIRLVVARHGSTGELVGPHVDDDVLEQLGSLGFSRLARLENEGGRDIHMDIYELSIPRVD
jgi:hypothetical protein